MFTIRDTHIRMTQGDTASFSVEIMAERDDNISYPYQMLPGDRLLFTAKRCLSDTSAALQLTAEGEPVFHIQPSDTKNMLGRYIYDLELRTHAGEIHTILGPGSFPEPELEILAEVTI